MGPEAAKIARRQQGKRESVALVKEQAFGGYARRAQRGVASGALPSAPQVRAAPPSGRELLVPVPGPCSVD